jgi:hypothetical protein
MDVRSSAHAVHPLRATLTPSNMNNLSFPKLLLRSCLAATFALALWSPIQAQAAMPDEGKMMKDCQQMKENKEKMMAEMKAQDAALTAQVAAMNSAPENQKPGLMAAIVTTLLEQRIARDAHRAQMEEEMMKHMMRHMQGKEDMAACPMMKGMDAMEDKSPNAQNEHHEMDKK